MNNNESIQSKFAALEDVRTRILAGEKFTSEPDLPIDPADVTETLGTDLQVGMHRIWNSGHTSTITAIVPDGRVRIKVSYCADHGKQNTSTVTYRKTSYFPIVAVAR